MRVVCVCVCICHKLIHFGFYVHKHLINSLSILTFAIQFIGPLLLYFAHEKRTTTRLSVYLYPYYSLSLSISLWLMLLSNEIEIIGAKMRCIYGICCLNRHKETSLIVGVAGLIVLLAGLC